VIVAALLLTLTSLATPAGPKFDQALHPRTWSFPRDHGRHDGFKTEWWYLTGNLRERATGRRFGYQLTFFRSAFVTHPTTTRPSPWAMTDLYFAHAALSDVKGKQFLHTDRLARARDHYALASDHALDVTLKDWSITPTTDNAFHLVSADPRFALDLTAAPGRGPILQGPGGLNPKGTHPGQASYYYSMPRMPTTGTITLDGRTFTVEGLSWMDHEFSSNALADNQSGWDWLALTLTDGTDLMIYRIRDKTNQTDYLSGTRIDPTGSVTYLRPDQIQLASSQPWKSPTSGAAYPQRWQLKVEGQPALSIQTRLDNQELQTPNSTDVTYYEGTVAVTNEQGAPIGEGYLEMTGYARSLTTP